MAKSHVKVFIRIRPLSSREKSTSSILQVINQQQVLISSLNSLNNNSKSFTFDRVFDVDSSQEDVFGSDVGLELIESGFLGYNACLFSYGQTGSGKTFTMLGGSSPLSQGVIPRLCHSIFTRINSDSTTNYKVEVSYMEIYNEKVRDLLSTSKNPLKVREHAALGPYVDGLSLLAVEKVEDIFKLMEEGSKGRTVAATNMNSESSRSHAVFTIILTQQQEYNSVTGEKVSRLSLVDLAGSERANKTGAVGERLKEGSNINKSLTTLGLVISKLAEGGEFVPYRDSALTWLLKDSLGGNSRTIMIGTVSPSGENYEETLSTLRYADRAKKIVNQPVINEDPNAKLIRELQAEVKQLRELLSKSSTASELSNVKNTCELSDQLVQSEKLMRQVSETWEEKLMRSEIVSAENKQALEKMGISVLSDEGISVQHNKFYLVNLNADPSLNELLVYYIKPRTIVGRPDSNCDIQLNGLGINSLHCELLIEDNLLYLIPYAEASCFVNGVKVEKKRLLEHGDRVLWGNHHFFRVNCPYQRENGLSEDNNYERAEAELQLAQLQSNPISSAVAALESKHRKDKQVALEKQRADLERQFSALINVLTPTGPPPASLVNNSWEGNTERKKNKISDGLKLLKECLLVVNKLVLEANSMVKEMGLKVDYGVTLMIPPGNLTPGRVKGAALVTSPSIRVTSPPHPPQIWSMEKLQNRLADMRDSYHDYKNNQTINSSPFFEPEQPHLLIGIANVFLQVLFYDDVTLAYPVPVISQQGEIVGRLTVEVSRVSSEKLVLDVENGDDEEAEGRTVTVKVTIRHLAGVNSTHFVFCQYVFCDHVVVVPPTSTTSLIRFDSTKYFTIPVSEEFIDYAEESALSIEVWGHRESDAELQEAPEPVSVTDRWREVTSQMRLWVEIQELNENGDYAPCPVDFTQPQTGGVHLLRQGAQRRLLITTETNTNGGQLPIVCDEIDQVSLGAVTPRSVNLQRPLDSYQEVDLSLVKGRWGDALRRRRLHLDSLLQELAKKEIKSPEEEAREKSLVSQWMTLTEERNAVLVPAPDSGVPGAPSLAGFKPELGMEEHVPVLFLDISEENLSSSNSSPAKTPAAVVSHQPTAGLNSLLPKEHDATFFALPMIRKSYGDFYSTWSEQRMSTESWALVSWDSSVHDCPALNKPTPPSELVYVIVRVAVRLSHPVPMELVLRKRLCLSIRRNRQSLTERIRMKLTFSKVNEEEENGKKKTGVCYQLVSHLPKSSEQLETRESLAELAVRNGGENYIEEYLNSISAVDSILNLDRMRQSVYLREQQLKSSRPKTLNNNNMRKTLSVPNISQLFTASNVVAGKRQQQPLQEKEKRKGTTRSESLACLSGVLNNSSSSSSRPCSLDLGTSQENNQQPVTGPGRWTSLMSTVPEGVEESGYASRTSEESPTTTG